VDRLLHTTTRMLTMGGRCADKVLDIDGAPSEHAAVIDGSQHRRPPTKPPGPPHQVLASEYYLEMFLQPDSGPPSAKQHARYELVCTAWARFESSTWDENFAPKFAYQWYYRMKGFLPEIATRRISKIRERDKARLKKAAAADEILGLDYENFLAVGFLVWWLCCFTGLILIGNYEDNGRMRDGSPYLVAIPFMIGPLILLAVLLYLAFREKPSPQTSSWHYDQRNEDVKTVDYEITQELTDAVGGDLTLSTHSLSQLERTTSAAPMQAESYFITEHNANEQVDTVSVNMRDYDSRELFTRKTREAELTQPDEGGDTVRARGLFPQAQAQHAPKPIVGRGFPMGRSSWGDGDTYAVRKSVWISVLVFGTLSLPAVTALLFAGGTSAIIAFVPLMIASCTPTIAFLVASCACSDHVIEDDDTPYIGVLYCLLLVPVTIVLLVFCVLYPLLLDGSISNSSTRDWSAALSHLWILAFALFSVSILSTIARRKMLRRQAEKGHGVSPCKSVALVGMWLTIVGFYFGLVALVLKASGRWDGMSYVAIIFVVGASITGFGLSSFSVDMPCI